MLAPPSCSSPPVTPQDLEPRRPHLPASGACTRTCASTSTPRAGTAAPSARATDYVVVPGDCLWSIAARRLGRARDARAVDRGWRAIYAANRDAIGPDPNLIHPGLVLTLPPLDPTPLTREEHPVPRHWPSAAWPDPIIDTLGHDPRSDYVERFWLPTLGPTSLLLLRRLASHLDREPEGCALDVADLSQSLGVGPARARRRRCSAASTG